MYGCVLSDVFKKFGGEVKDVVLLGDVTYGACCVDDLGAKALGCDFLGEWLFCYFIGMKRSFVFYWNI